MSLVEARGTGRSTFRRGIHPAEEKELCAEAPIEVLPTPAQVQIPLLQHLGAPCRPSVKPRQEVAIGDKVGDVDTLVTAPVHASVAGKVGRETVTTLPNGRHVGVLPITAGEQELEGETLYDDLLGGDWPLDEIERFAPAEIVQAVREAGLVGMGGAAFPTHVKLAAREDRPVHTVLVNGSECEPYLTADYRMMLEAPEPILAGALLAARAMDARRGVVGIEDNKPAAIRRMRAVTEGVGVEVAVVRTKYPQGAEKQLVRAVLGSTVPMGGLPLNVGVLVINVETAASVARAVLRGKPPYRQCLRTWRGPAPQPGRAHRHLLQRAARGRRRRDARRRPHPGRRADDGLLRRLDQRAHHQGHRRGDRADPRRPPARPRDCLCSLRPLRRRLPAVAGADPARPGGALQELGPGPPLLHHLLHGVRLLRLGLPGPDPAGAADPRRQGRDGDPVSERPE